MAALTVVGCCAFAGFAVAAPLAVYSVTLALFGLPHVLSELRYVDRRFGRRINRRLLAAIVGILGLIVATRAAWVFHLVPPAMGLVGELCLVALLALTVARGTAERRAVAIAVALLIGAATAVAPFDTVIALAVLHNLTPLGFLWQLAPQDRRWQVMTPAILALLGLPLFVATGLPRLMLTGAGPASLDPLDAGPLGQTLGAYVPPVLTASPHAVDLFTGSVVAQGGHYLSVIVVLPWLLSRIEPGARGILPWPRTRWFFALSVVAALVSLAGFAIGFADARAVYGIAASLHAWLEIPVLILALTGAVQRNSNSPATQDAVLATSETSIAR